MVRPFRWGILGTARINQRVLPGFRDAGHAIAIVGSREPARGKAAAQALGAERAGSYDDVLRAEDVDAIYLSLPNALHAPWTIRAAEAGKHVLCEKPLAPSVEECEAIVGAGRRAGVKIGEAFMYRHHPRWARVRGLLGGGEIGELRALQATFGFALRATEDIRLSAEMGGGAIQDVGCYCVNMSRWLLGEPTEVRGFALDGRGVGVDTHAVATLRYEGGALATLACSIDSAMGHSAVLVGDRGRIEVADAFLPNGETTVRIGDRVETVPPVNQYGLQFAAFERHIRQGEPFLTPAEDAIGTQRVIAEWRRVPG